MINKAAALKDLDRLSLEELTTIEIEKKYQMPLNTLIELTGWKATTTVTNIVNATPLVEEIMADPSTKEGQEALAIQAVTAIIDLLSPLEPDKQRRVIESIAVYFGVVLGSQ